ncbi:flagellar biosynthetic protein FliR [Dethiobacter alkaliphilus]|uniref:Flagellar biosynthetic protein FliR n=1 Tax=Dethiobacter alkaliphilus AHT 1 TaxID=555088 RepID=C0GJG4_DETAL|nr:flagellar biosynthetic protein FliR [Dethiobacter alkaliphilus]EEG76511.1 flagellar biosynthetic protein FliR [Dethiobacter alkaliphilus AHT 1]MCW3488732.1 flagellar biosynthetic protein FliR [Dethiobacter alkaliphilus]
MVLEQWSVLFLIFVRLSALIAVLPFFTWRGIPALPKIGFAGVFAYLIFLASSPQEFEIPEHFYYYVLAVGSEVLFGLALGFLVLLIFAAARIAGQMVDVQAGLMMASVFDPQFGSQVTLFGQFYYLFALVFYLTVNGHHMLFMAIARSIELVTPGGVVFSPQLIPNVMQFIFQMFIIAFQLAVPVVAVLIFSDLALGLLSKTVPQLHVFMVGMPLKVGVALFIIYLIFPYLAQVLETVFARMQEDIIHLFNLF